MGTENGEDNVNRSGRWQRVLMFGAATAIGAGTIVALFSDLSPILWGVGAFVGGSVGAALGSRAK